MSTNIFSWPGHGVLSHFQGSNRGWFVEPRTSHRLDQMQSLKPRHTPRLLSIAPTSSRNTYWSPYGRWHWPCPHQQLAWQDAWRARIHRWWWMMLCNEQAQQRLLCQWRQSEWCEPFLGSGAGRDNAVVNSYLWNNCCLKSREVILSHRLGIPSASHVSYTQSSQMRG